MNVGPYLDQILELVGDGIVVEDDDGCVTFANSAAEQLLGQGPGELLGRCWAALVPRPPPAATEGARGCEVEICHPDGRAIPLKVSAHRLTDGGQARSTLWLLAHSADGRQETQVQQSAEMSELRQFFLGAVHELNNALTIILLQIRLLYNVAPMLPRFQEGLAGIKEQVQRITRMTNDLLAMARAGPSSPPQSSPLDGPPPEPATNRLAADEREMSMSPTHFGLAAPAGLFPEPKRLHGEPIPADVNAIIQATLDLQMYNLQSDGIDVILNLDPGLPAARVDPDQLQQVLINLIKNAQQAVGTVQRRGRISIGTTIMPSLNGCGTRVQIQVSDNGPGIPHDAMLHLFRPFFSTKPPGEGTGLGLAICNRIVREHGGRIWAENNSQAGVTFFVELPQETQ